MQPELSLGVQPRSAFETKASILEDAGARELDPVEFLARLYGSEPVERMICVFSDLDTYRTYADADDLLEAATFRADAYVTPCSFYRGHYGAKTLRQLFAFVVDLDHLDPSAVRYVIQRIAAGDLLRPTLIVNSGGGLHLYYIMTVPVEVYRHRYDTLLSVKRALTRHVQRIGKGQTDMLSLVQAHRLPGSKTKNGDRVGAFETGDAWDFRALVEELHLKLPKNFGADAGTGSNATPKKKTAQVAQVLPFMPRSPKFYKACIARLFGDRHAAAGRERALFALAVVGYKAGMRRDEVERDTLQLAELFNAYKHEHGLPEVDIRREMRKWMVGYSATYVRMRGSVLADFFGWEWGAKAIKRNGRPQKVHLARLAGAKSAEAALRVAEYRAAHPNASQSQCARETGMSKSTLSKYWRKAEPGA